MKDQDQAKKGFSLKGLAKSIGLVEDIGEDGPQIAETTKATEPVQTAPSQTPNMDMAMATVAVPTMGAFDQKIFDALNASLDEHEVGDVCYLEFYRAKNALANSQPGMPAGSMYNSTYIMLKATAPKLTKEHILETADHYLGVLDAEEKEFNQAIEQKKSTDIQKRIDSQSINQKAIDEKKKQIEAINAEISTLMTENLSLQNDIVQAQSKLDSRVKNFGVTINIMRNSITTDKENIKTYIQ